MSSWVYVIHFCHAATGEPPLVVKWFTSTTVIQRSHKNSTHSYTRYKINTAKGLALLDHVGCFLTSLHQPRSYASFLKYTKYLYNVLNRVLWDLTLGIGKGTTTTRATESHGHKVHMVRSKLFTIISIVSL